MSNARFSILQARAVEDRRISDAQFRTLAALGRFGNKAGWCFPGLQALGEILHKSAQAVSKDVASLVELGYLEKRPRYDRKGSQTTNLYRLKFDLPPQPGDTPPSTSEVDPPSTSEVEVTSHLTPHNNAREEDGNLLEILGEITDDPDTPIRVASWVAVYSREWVLQAVKLARAKRARSLNYVETVLLDWKTNGQPAHKPAKKPARANGSPSRTGAGQSRDSLYSYTEDELAAARADMKRQLLGVT